MKKILVTGGTGLVGTYLQNEIDAVYVGSNNFDLTKESDVIKMYETYKPEIVIHLAAKVGGILDNISDPFGYYEKNVLMNTFVVKYAREYKVNKFLGVLSSCIYPDISDHYPLVESDLHNNLPNKNNFGYGYSKRLLGVHIDIARNQGLNYSYIIPSNLYGEYETGDYSKKHFVGSLLDKIFESNKNNDSKIILFGDGTPLRQFTFAKDIAEIIKLIITYDIKENMNLSHNENLSIDEISKIALKITNSEHLKIEYDATKPNGQFRKDISTDVFNKIFPNYKFTSYYDGLKKTYDSLKLNKI